MVAAVGEDGGTVLLNKRLLVWLTRVNNIVSLVGVILVTTAALLWLLMLPAALGGSGANPYLGFVNAALLGAFLAGLLLIPIGVRIFGKTAAFIAGGRRLTIVLGLATAANLVIGSHLTYSTVHYMDGVEFCGTACHVMTPEFNAWRAGAHSGLKCVDCHIAPGAEGYMEAKANGLRQLVSFLWGNYSRPIPSPEHGLPTAKETCERCHRPGTQYGDRLRVHEQFADDASNTRSVSVVLMRVDKIHAAHREIHVQWKEGAKATAVGFRTGEDRYGAGEGGVEMTCLDCHNRPSHAFETPDQALDRAFAAGRIRAALPSAKKTALELLRQSYPTTAEARAAIASGFPGRVAGAGAGEVAELQAIYERNVSPEMKLEWGAHANHLGHLDSPGCFRCHEDSFKTAGGKTMTQDCEACHSIPAASEANPKILEELGWRPR